MDADTQSLGINVMLLLFDPSNDLLLSVKPQEK